MRIFLQLIMMIAVIAVGFYFAGQIQQIEPIMVAAEDDSHSMADAEEIVKGPHGGRLLTQNDFQLEITLYEQGVPPEFRVYAYRGGSPITPDEIDLTITLGRLGGKTDTIRFKSQEDYLRGDSVVYEPHSFDVTVTALHANQRYNWQYAQHEGRVIIADETALAAGIVTATVAPGEIDETLTLQGSVTYDANRIRRVMARYPGLVRMVNHTVGAQVQAGEVIAQVESNDSLQTYDIKAPVSGIIIEQQIMAGETTADKPIYVIANMNKVWVDLAVFRRDLPKLAVGQSVRITSFDGAQKVGGVVGYISPVSAATSQSTTVRIYLDNPDGHWRPGMAVNGTVTLSTQEVPLAVRNSALQKFRDFDVVYARYTDTYEVRMLELGKTDGAFTEVLGGVDPGTEYVVENSYLIKADIEKSGASHDH